MQMPSLLTPDLFVYGQVSSEQQLWTQLVQKPEDLVRFFVCSCDDETWSNQYSQFTSQAIAWITKQFFLDLLHPDLAKLAAKAIREHFANVKNRIPYNIECRLAAADGSVIYQSNINSLLFQTASPFFHHIIRTSCNEKNQDWFILNDVAMSDFITIEEFVYTDDVKELYRLRDFELKQLLFAAINLELFPLAEMCQIRMKKFITAQNILQTLSMALDYSLEIIKQACCDLINSGEAGFALFSRGPHSLVCELKQMSEPTLDVFTPFKPLISELICGRHIIEDPNFVDILKSCPKLTTLDLGQTVNYNDSLLEIPKQIQSLVLAGCHWLTNNNFSKLVKICPNVQKLDLQSCGQITAKAWGELLRLGQLRSLDLTRCDQLKDDELLIIIHSTKGLTDLSLGGCRRLTEKGFQHIARSKLRLLRLDLNRTDLSDTPLIEIAMRMNTLRYLNIQRCLHLTEHGIVEALKTAPALKEVNITQCNIPRSVVEEICKIRPMLNIIKEE